MATMDQFDAWVQTAFGVTVGDSAARDPANDQAIGGPIGGPSDNKPQQGAGSADDILAKANKAKDAADEAHRDFLNEQTVLSSMVGITGQPEDIEPQLLAAIKEVHKSWADAKHAVKTGNLAQAAKLAETATTQAKAAHDMERRWAKALDDKVETAKTVAIGTPWGEVRHLEEQSLMVNSRVLGMVKLAHSDLGASAKLGDKMNEVEDATKPLQPYLKDPKSAQDAVDKSAKQGKDKTKDALMYAEMARQSNKILEIKATLDAIISQQIETARTQYSAASDMLAAEKDNAKAQEILAEIEKQKARFDLLLKTAKGLTIVIATGGEAAVEGIADMAEGLIEYYHEQNLKGEAEELQKLAGELRNTALNALMQQASSTAITVGTELDKLRNQVKDDTKDAARLLKKATSEFDTKCDCKLKFTDIEKAMALVRSAQELSMARQKIWTDMEQVLDLVKGELKMSPKDRPSGQFYEDHNGMVFGKVYTEIVQRSEEAKRQGAKIDNLLPPMVAVYQNAFSGLKV